MLEYSAAGLGLFQGVIEDADDLRVGMDGRDALELFIQQGVLAESALSVVSSLLLPPVIFRVLALFLVIPIFLHIPRGDVFVDDLLHSCHEVID